MAKILLVEDDINLSEIYKTRLEAEGYTIVSAVDGEAALALAVKEHPDLIICDVMMPKISGFEMLDILRGTLGIQNTKVIIMTALSQAEDKERATALGADRYLVKSQVTLEDVVQTAKDILAENGVIQTSTASPAASTSPPTSQPSNQDSTVNSPVQPAPPANSTSNSNSSGTASSPSAPAIDSSDTAQSTPSTKLPEINANLSQSSASEEKSIDQQIENFVGQPPAAQTNSNQTPPDPSNIPTARSSDGISISGKKVIQPINDPNAMPDLDLLLAKEQAKELEKAGTQPVVIDPAKAAVESSGYLDTPVFQPGQTNPNSNTTVDPNNIAI